jgi:methylated-DNA-[protein]-cysteine S-methyltransferase
MTAWTQETFSHPRFSAQFLWDHGRLWALHILPPAPASAPASPWGPLLAHIIATWGTSIPAWPNLPLARQRVSAFSWRVLHRLHDLVPWGTTTTYGHLAQILGTSPRAIGRVMASNPWPLLFPCHRVLAAHGLGGYGPGTVLKTILLQEEGSWPKAGFRSS